MLNIVFRLSCIDLLIHIDYLALICIFTLTILNWSAYLYWLSCIDLHIVLICILYWFAYCIDLHIVLICILYWFAYCIDLHIAYWFAYLWLNGRDEIELAVMQPFLEHARLAVQNFSEHKLQKKRLFIH